MKYNISQKFKRLVSVALALIVLMLSVFVTDMQFVRAASLTDTWDGSKADSYAGGSGTSQSPYIIENAEQLYKMVVDEGVVNGTAAHFKVADNVRSFYLSPSVAADIAAQKTADEIVDNVKDSSATYNWNKELNYLYNATEGGFKGSFDGNGATIYGLKAIAEDRAAFIPVINDVSNVTIKNIAFEYSYIETTTTDSSHATSKGVVTAAVLNWYSGPSNTTDFTTTFDNISIKHVRASARKSTDVYTHHGAIMAWPMNMKVVIKDCLVVDIDKNMSALLGNGGNKNNVNHTLTNCIVVNADAIPYTNTDSNNSNSSLAYANYQNCYFTGYSQLKNPYSGEMVNVAIQIDETDIIGDASKTLLSTVFDCNNIWILNNGLPELRVFHNIEQKPLASNRASGHTSVCTICELQGLGTVNHTMQNDPDIANQEKCLYCDYTRSAQDYAVKVYMADPSVGHAKTSVVDGTVSGEVTAHTMITDPQNSKNKICSVCGYLRVQIDMNDNTSYITQLTVGEKLENGRYSERYKYNLSGSGITSSSGNAAGNPYGQNSYVNGYDHGTFSRFSELIGSGTEADPYIISDALTLYAVLASGSTNYGAPLHFKLGCDIDLGNTQWIGIAEQWFATHWIVYKYKGFAGVLDGNGHTVSGMKTDTADDAAGFIPVLASGGVIKNLHIRSSSAKSSASGAAVGVLVGEAQAGSQIIGCSVEGSGNTALVGKNYGTVKNSYALKENGSSTYYNENGDTVSPNSIDLASNRDIWYRGGASGSALRLVNNANANMYVDVNGDGIANGYDATDVTALKSHLLWDRGYENIFGDVDRSGKTDITDLAILQRHLASTYNQKADGFWRGVELSKFKIYYTDNDMYDFARKLELYFKETVGVEVEKQKATARTQYAIVLKEDTTLTSDYKIEYSVNKATLTFSGKTFTGVEQAVLDFIANSDYKLSTVYETDNGTLPAEKQSITVNNKQYNYAWGDEFDSGSVVNGNTTVDYSKWYIKDMGSDSTVGAGNTSQFRNMKFAGHNGLAELNVVANGKLTMHRGIDYGKNHVGEKTGYLTSIGGSTTFDNNDIATSGQINTKNSMLFKRGYLEMKCTLPSDGYAFPAWWLLTTAGNNNVEISRSLYSKVYELNEDYDYAFYYTPDNYKTYKYKLPTASFEIDIFEIIQQPTVYGSVAYPSSSNKYQYTIHKWYVHSKTVKGNNLPLKVYDLDWANVKANGGFTQVLDATHNGSQYVKNWGTLDCHANNMAGGEVNADISRNGNKTSKYTRSYLDRSYTPDSNDQTSATFGFLWDEEQLTLYIYKSGSTTPITIRVDIADLNYDGVGFDMEQYAYMLMENHLFTNSPGKSAMPSNLTDCTMEVDYVRLYQLDGQRDIVTPETEAFNNPANRFGN